MVLVQLTGAIGMDIATILIQILMEVGMEVKVCAYYVQGMQV